jgi:hypothetical protein
MISIRYNNYFINGVDKSGKVEQLPDIEATRMVNLGYAVFVEVAPGESVDERPQRKARGKKRGSKN